MRTSPSTASAASGARGARPRLQRAARVREGRRAALPRPHGPPAARPDDHALTTTPPWRSTPRRALGPHSTEEDVEQYIQDHIRPLEERVRGALLSAAASSRERERAAGARDLLPPEKRHKGAAGGGRRPPLHHQRSSHL